MEDFKYKRCVCMSIWILSALSSIIDAQSFVTIKAPLNAEVTPGSITDTAMLVTWDIVPKADSYTVTLKPPTISASGVGPSILEKFTFIQGLDPDTEYKVTIRATKGEITGNPAVVVQRTALPSPSSIWAVEESITEDSMTVEWEGVTGAQSYTVEVVPSAGVGGPGNGIYATSVRLQGLSPNTRYTIHVFAVNWVADGAKAELHQHTKLRPPRNLRIVRATVTPTTIGVQWDEVVGVINYVVKVIPNDGMLGLNPRVQDTHLVLRNLHPDTQYRIQIAAQNVAGPSTFSSVTQRTLSMCFAVANDFVEDTFDLTCPSQCARFQDQVFGTREYTSDSRVCAAAIHDGRIDNNAGGLVRVKKRPGILDFVGTTRNGITTKDYKAWHPSFVFALQSPSNLEILEGSIEFDRATLIWSPVSGAEAYRVSVDPYEGVKGIKSNIEDTRVTLTGLNPNTAFRVYVSAVNRVETSDAATVVLRTTLPALSNVHVLNTSVYYDRFTIVWDSMAGTIGYQVTVKSSEQIVFREETEITRLTPVNLTSGIMYNVSVQAINEIGLGQPVWINQYTTLRAPINVRISTVRHDSMEIMWDPASGAALYNVTVRPCCAANVLEIDRFSRIIRSMWPNTLYNISVAAYNENEQSSSIVLQQRTILQPPIVSRVDGSLSHDGAIIKWFPLDGATSYSILVVTVDNEQSRNFTTIQTRFKLSGLTQRTRYIVTVAGISAAGKGEYTSVGFTTVIQPPMNVRHKFDALKTDIILFTWDQVPDATQYYVSCEPSDGLFGTGAYVERKAKIQGLRMNVPYTLKIMAQIGRDNGMNATINFTSMPPVPKIISLHSVTSRSLTMTWQPSFLRVSKVSYRTGRSKKYFKSPDDSTVNNLVFDGLTPEEEYLFEIYSDELAVGVNDGPEELPLVQQIFKTGSNISTSSLSVYDVTLFWPFIPSARNYLVSIDPDMPSGAGNVTSTSVFLRDFDVTKEYNITVITEAGAEGIQSMPASLQILENGRPSNGGRPTTDVETDFVGGNPPPPSDLFPTDNRFGNRNNVDNGADQNTDDEEATGSKKSNKMWIAIVIVVACLLVLLILVLVPCCCCWRRKQSLLRNSGWRA